MAQPAGAAALDWLNPAIIPNHSYLSSHPDLNGPARLFPPFHKRPAIPAIIEADGEIITTDTNLADQPVIEASLNEILVIIIDDEHIQFESAAGSLNTQSSDIPHQQTQQGIVAQDGTFILSTLSVLPVSQTPLLPEIGFTLSSALWAGNGTVVAKGGGTIQINLLDQSFRFSSAYDVADAGALSIDGGGQFALDPNQLLTAKTNFNLLGLINDEVTANLHAVINHSPPQGILGTLTPERPLDLFAVLSFTSYD